MPPYLTAAQAAEQQTRLAGFRTVYSSESAPVDERLSACCDLVQAYQRLGLGDRAADWVRWGASLCDESAPHGLQARYHLLCASVWLDREDWLSASLSLERLSTLRPVGVEQEREWLAAQVQLALGSGGEPFAPLEKAFRHLRHHPSPFWAAAFWGWKGRWLAAQDRLDEASLAFKRALVEAERSQDVGAILLALLDGAESPGAVKAKALRAAKAAVELADGADVPGARARAQALVSRLTGGRKESESSLAFQASFAADREESHRRARMDREAREADLEILEASRQGRRHREAQTLASIASRLASEEDLSHCLDALYLSLRTLMAADVFGIALLSEGGEALDYSLFIEEGRRTRVGLIPVQSPRSLGAWCFRERKSVRVNDIDREYALYLKELSKLSEHRPKSMLFQPLVAGKEAVGIITVQAFAKGAYGPEAEAQLAVVAACVSLRLQSPKRSA